MIPYVELVRLGLIDQVPRRTTVVTSPRTSSDSFHTASVTRVFCVQKPVPNMLEGTHKRPRPRSQYFCARTCKHGHQVLRDERAHSNCTGFGSGVLFWESLFACLSFLDFLAPFGGLMEAFCFWGVSSGGGGSGQRGVWGGLQGAGGLAGGLGAAFGCARVGLCEKFGVSWMVLESFGSCGACFASGLFWCIRGLSDCWPCGSSRALFGGWCFKSCLVLFWHLLEHFEALWGALGFLRCLEFLVVVVVVVEGKLFWLLAECSSYFRSSKRNQWNPGHRVQQKVDTARYCSEMQLFWDGPDGQHCTILPRSYFSFAPLICSETNFGDLAASRDVSLPSCHPGQQKLSSYPYAASCLSKERLPAERRQKCA